MNTKKKDLGSGAAQLFEMMIYPIYDDLYRYIYSIVRNSDYASDVMQNTLLMAFIHLDDLNNPEKFKMWIFKISKNEALKLFRKGKNEIPFDYDANKMKHGSNADEIIISKETRQEIRQAINNLKFKYRQAVVLKYYSDLTYSEIAAALNTSTINVKSWLARAKKMLVKSLDISNTGD